MTTTKNNSSTKSPFDRGMSNFGVRIDETIFPQGHPIRAMGEIARIICSYAVEHEFRVKRSIYFGFFEGYTIRATAHSDDNDYIGVSIGTAALFLQVFQRLMCDRSFLYDIGRADFEPPDIEPVFIPWDARNIDWNWPTPKCKIRQRVAIEMALLAFIFMICHELTHIQQGHLEFLKKIKTDPTIHEKVAQSQNDNLTKQAFELLADFHEASRVLRRALDSRDACPFPTFRKRQRQALESMYATTARSLYFPMLAIAISWRIFDEQYWHIDNLGSRSHPPIPVRQLSLNASIGELVKSQPLFDISDEEVEAILLKAIVDAEAGFLKLTGLQEPDVRGYDSMLEGTPTFDHFIKIMNLAEKMNHELNAYAWGIPGVKITT